MHAQLDQPATEKTIENPFATHLRSTRSSGKRAVVAALKTLLFVSLALAAIVATNHTTQDWLLSRHTADYDQLSSEERSVRLVEIAQFGPRALPNLVTALCDPELSVARTAWRLIQDQQKSWALMKPNAEATHHTKLLQRIHDVADKLTRDRTTWANQLVQTSLAKLRNNQTLLASDLQILADRTLDRLSVSQNPRDDSGSTSVASVAENQNTSSIRIVSKTEPLPIATKWIDAEIDQGSTPATDMEPSTNTVAVNDSRVALKAVDPSVVSLQPVQPTAPTPTSPPATEKRTSTEPMLATSSLETMDSQTVVRLLAHDDENVRTDATLQLGARGWTQPQIELAGRLVSGSIEGRLQVIDRLAAAREIDPRQWLIFLLGDSDVRIRRRVVAILATFDDDAITKHLQEHQLGEVDPEIRTLIAKQVAPSNVYRR